MINIIWLIDAFVFLTFLKIKVDKQSLVDVKITLFFC